MYTFSYHANRSKDFHVDIVANEGVPSDPDNPYYRLTFGQAVDLYLTDAQCKQILDCLGSRPPLPQPEPECTCVRIGDMADARFCEVHK